MAVSRMGLISKKRFDLFNFPFFKKRMSGALCTGALAAKIDLSFLGIWHEWTEEENEAHAKNEQTVGTPACAKVHPGTEHIHSMGF